MSLNLILGIFLMLIIKINICHSNEGTAHQKPNIIFYIADDLGFNDVSFHGSDQILTPNIDALAYNGVILNRFYTATMCTPSRSSLLTGKYTNRIGMQHYVILNDSPYGLGIDQKIIPQYLKEVGYQTYLIGKWHLGFYQKQYTPTMRGFDSFFGYYGAYIDYYDYSLEMLNRNYSRGYDIRKNLTVNYDIPPGTYATDLFTDEAVKTIENHNYNDHPMFLFLSHLAPHSGNEDNPMQAPQSEIDKFKHISDKGRRTYAAMVSKLDSSVGRVVKALKQKNILDNTVIIFISDNGAVSAGMHMNYGSNYPMRGQKNSGWEGAIRNVGFIYSSLISSKHRVSHDWFHITDFLPTIASLAGFTISDDIDGFDQWDSISTGTVPSTRYEILHVTDPIDHFSSYTFENWKLVNGTTSDGIYDGWLGKIENYSIMPEEYVNKIKESDVGNCIETPPSEVIWRLRKESTVKCIDEQIDSAEFTCNPLKSPCLFNIIKDPCEQLNLAKSNSKILEYLQLRLEEHILKSVEPRNQPSDPRADPANFHNTWNWWIPEDIHREL